MMETVSKVIFLPPAGGGTPAIFRDALERTTRFETVGYPGWRRYVDGNFSAEALISELTTEIAQKIPDGPIRVVGMSLGGHLGYAAALRLQAMGREIAGLCAIDSFMIDSSDPSPGWKGRALKQGLELLRKGRIGEFSEFIRSKFWRAVLRLSTSGASGLRTPASVLTQTADPILEEELSMRLLLREVAPWIASLDHAPVPLNAPTAFLRTRMNAADDSAWRRRCPNCTVAELPGDHHTLLEPENVGSLREAVITSLQSWKN
jgi:thioesterase domain-containing protein